MPENGQQIGHYKILSSIGAGGMGEVYLAEDTKLDRRVALKILPAEFAENADRMSRFVREAKSASALNHPNIITIYEIGESDGTHFIATEFIDGKTLNDYKKVNPLDYKAALEIAIQVASALEEAHSAGIVHRDIKPDNIMVRANGLAKILDFGIAKLSARGETDEDAATAIQSNTQAGMIIGTPNYMSPEQAKGQAVDARSDIFSFGVVLYELLSGKLPFAGETAMETIAAIINKVPLPLSADVPPEIERIISKTLLKDKNERYQTIKALLVDLKDGKLELDVQYKSGKTVSPDKEEPKTQILQAAATAEEANPTITAKNLNDSLTIKKSNVSKPLIGVLAVLLIAAISAGYWFYRGSNYKQIESIAVMPFINESGNADAEYLSDGMTETLISSLSQLPNVSVKARSSVFRYKGKEIDPQKIASELNVQAILNGRVMQRGEQLILNLELVDSKTENVIWSESYNRNKADLVSLQSEIARDVSSKLKSKLSGADEQKLNKVYTTDPEAYQLYLKGRFYWNKLTPEDIRRSLEFYQQAIEKDPTFALAYAGISDAYMLLGIPDGMLGTLPPQESLRKASYAADKALEIDPTLSEAYTARAHVKWKKRDWAGADEDFKRSIELNGNYPNSHRFYAIYLASAGRSDEAIREVKRAEELEPLEISVKAHAASIYYFARRYDEAVEAGKKAIEFDASSPVSHQRLGWAYEQEGMFPEAIAEFQKAVNGSNRIQLAVASLAHAFALAGKRAEAEKLLTELKERSGSEYVSSYLIAEVLVALGEKEAAFKYLDKAYEEGSIDLVLAKVDPKLDPLRDDPRFQQLLKRISFPN